MKEYAKKTENISCTIQKKSKASEQVPISKILKSYKNRTEVKSVLHQNIDEDELLQAKTAQQDHVKVILQRYAHREEGEHIHSKFESTPTFKQEFVPIEKKTNNTGLPDNLKTGIENLSGYNMDDVRVHYNSNKPAQLQALAYTQGTDIHVAPGQEKHIPHEAWHVVQQKQGRVQPTMQLQGVNVNDNEGLEKEADAMGERGNEVTENTYSIYNIPTCITQMTTVVQRDWECKECGASGKGKGGKKCKECNAITSDVQRRMNFGDWWDSIEDKRRQDLLRSHGSHETSGGVNRGNDEHTGGVARAMKQIKKKYEAGKYN
jgi:hypothetical protein